MKCDTSMLSNTTSVVAQSGRITEGNSIETDKHEICVIDMACALLPTLN